MSTTGPTVFIKVPKYVAITPSSLPKIRPAPTPQVKIISANYDDVSNSSAGEECAPRGKKRRLDHLTWEEKVQRKKLKNRVAAQTSRDRKKARMEEMEHEIKTLTQRTELLQNKCEGLQAINDSLLEKNRKLDMEVEILRQQFTELEQKHQQYTSSMAMKAATESSVATCTGSGLTSNGLTVTAGTTEKERNTSSSMEDCCTLPSLQDMLTFDEEFDAGKLEELAESLLADITAEMETSDRESSEITTETSSGAERLSGRVVGTTTECLESSEYTTAVTESGCINFNPIGENESTTETESVISAAPTPPALMTLPDKLQLNGNESQQPIVYPASSETQTCTEIPDTVYGTYDAKTNSITIVLDDDAVPVNEAVEEIYCEGSMPAPEDDYVKCPSPAASPSQVYLNVDGCSDNEDDLDFAPIAEFLRPKRPLVSPLAKSPALSLHSAFSDHGYESVIGSPSPTSAEHFDTNVDDFAWNNSFDELFPALV